MPLCIINGWNPDRQFTRGVQLIITEYVLCCRAIPSMKKTKWCCLTWKYPPNISLSFAVNLWWSSTDFQGSERTSKQKGVFTESVSVEIMEKVPRGQRCVCVAGALPGCIMIICLRQQMDFQFSVNGIKLCTGQQHWHVRIKALYPLCQIIVITDIEFLSEQIFKLYILFSQ